MSGYLIAYMVFAALFLAWSLITFRGGGDDIRPALINLKRIKAFFQRQPDNDQGAVEGAFPADRFEGK